MSPAIAGVTLTRRHYLTLVVAVGVLAALVWFRDRIDLKSLHDHAGEFNGVAVVAALTLLPLVGFPVSVLHALAGAKFGLGLGLVFVAFSIVVQLCASYALVRAAPGFFARRFDWLRRRLPPATHRALTLFTMLLPGAPYFAQNYVLPVAGVPFAIFFGYSFPIIFSRSLVGVIFGEWSGHMTPGRIALFVLYSVAITLSCALAFRRLRAQLRNRPPAGSGLTPPAPCGRAAR